MRSDVNKELVKAVLDFVEQPKEQQTLPALVLIEAMKAAFKQGGLDKVDRLIETINGSIREIGGKSGLGAGAALQSTDSPGDALYLHIYFASFEFDNVIARQAILLDPQSKTAPD